VIRLPFSKEAAEQFKIKPENGLAKGNLMPQTINIRDLKTLP